MNFSRYDLYCILFSCLSGFLFYYSCKYTATSFLFLFIIFLVNFVFQILVFVHSWESII